MIWKSRSHRSLRVLVEAESRGREEGRLLDPDVEATMADCKSSSAVSNQHPNHTQCLSQLRRGIGKITIVSCFARQALDV